MRIAVIGVPFNSSGVPGGEADGPRALREQGLVAALAGRHDVADLGDVDVPAAMPDRDPLSGIIAPEALAGMVASTAEAVAVALTDDPAAGGDRWGLPAAAGMPGCGSGLRGR